MNPVIRTAIFAGAALVLVITAWATSPRIGTGPGFEDEGEPFFPDFTEPGQATTLEVFEVDAQTATLDIFKVQRKDGVWTIPSEYDYPADAKDRMAEAAGMLIGLEKSSVRSDARSEHGSLGVIDPRDKDGDIEGRGLLVSMKDGEGATLGEIIIGNEVEGREGMRFVRIPEKRRTYVAKIPATLSTAFEDWVETDLLKLTSWDVEKLIFDNYSVDERAGMVRPGEKIVVAKEDSGWKVEGQAEDEEANSEKIDGATRALDDMKIVGVRPKPEGLDERLRTAEGYDLAVLARSLQGKGFFLGRDRLYSNEGDLLVTTKDGVHYTLAFGEILLDTVGKGGDEEKEDEGEGEDEGEDGEKKKDGRPNRYLMVTVEIAKSRLEKPEGEEIPAEEIAKRKEAMRKLRLIVEKVAAFQEEKEALPKTLAEAIADEKELEKDPWGNPFVYALVEEEYLVNSFGKDGKPGGVGPDADFASNSLHEEDDRLEAAEAIRKWKTDLDEAKEKVEELSKRFAPWYYVIDAELYDKLKLARKDLVKAKETDEEEDGNDGEKDTPPTPDDDDSDTPDDSDDEKEKPGEDDAKPDDDE